MVTDRKLLVADASSYDRAIISTSLKNTYAILEANNGTHAFELFFEHADSIKLAIIDISLPRLNGYELLKKIKLIPKIREIPIILVGTDVTKENVIMGLKLGATDFIVKPFEQAFFRQRILGFINNLSTLSSKALLNLVGDDEFYVQEVKQYDNSMNKTFRNIFAFRNIESPRHLRRISLFTGCLLKKLYSQHIGKLDLTDYQIELITRASIYHDLGKVAIPDAILLNSNNLSSSQQDIFNLHTLKGAEILQLNLHSKFKDYITLCANIASYHHERWNGSGYPNGLVAHDIPLSAQAVGLATTIDSFTREFHCTSYNFFEIAMESILIDKEQFNPELLKALAQSELIINKIIDKYKDMPK